MIEAETAAESAPKRALSIPLVREDLGRIWGLGRAITRAELARALDLSPRFGGSHISKLESGKTTLSGPIEVAIRMMLDGARPYTMEHVIKPGYPRGPAR
jgi:hypothetical protein